MLDMSRHSRANSSIEKSNTDKRHQSAKYRVNEILGSTKKYKRYIDKFI